jgi:hypothetical protein
MLEKPPIVTKEEHYEVFDIAFNVGKLYNKSKNTSKKRKKLAFYSKNQYILFFILFIGRKNCSANDFCKVDRKIAA